MGLGKARTGTALAPGAESCGTRLHSTLGYLSPAEYETTPGKEDLGQVA